MITCNAVLQWVPDHLELLPRWVDGLAPGGWLAFQLPGNFDRAAARGHHRDGRVAAVAAAAGGPEFTRQAGDLTGYLDVLAGAGCRVDAWETTYLHILAGANPVVEWVKGTALRPVLSVLDQAQTAEFLAEYADRMARAYPARPFGTVLPFRRVFVVAQRPD